jgi:TBC1 domain family member 8/9
MFLFLRKQSDEHRLFFRIPQYEVLDGKIKGEILAFQLHIFLLKKVNLSFFAAKLWCSYEQSKRFASGDIFLSQNFLCFKSEVPNLVNLVIPFRIIKVSKLKI